MIDLFLFILLVSFALGFGSFATMAVYRLPNNIPWISRKPFCPKCQHELSLRDYFSLISVFIYRGKCRFCKAVIEYRYAYFFTELLVLIYFTINYVSFGFSDIFIINSWIILALVIWSMIYASTHKHFEHILRLCLFFLCLKLVSLGLTINALVFKISFAVLTVTIAWHLYSALAGRWHESFDYLSYSNKPRFVGEQYIIVKLGILLMLSLPATLSTFVIFYLLAAPILAYYHFKPALSLALLANLIALVNCL
jgi:prepilin signal peptidase PulO-like enzyme (type II secretory pathway)